MNIVIISNNDWDGLWYQRQQFARMYAERGHRVLFVNKTLQRWPKVRDFKERFTKKAKAMPNPIPTGVEVLSIYTLPPLRTLRAVNRWLLRRKLRRLGFDRPDALLTYIPTYTAIDIIDLLQPRVSAYINVHNYDADEVVKDLLRAERDMCRRVDVLLGDSVYNRGRLERISGREVFDALPGVNVKVFTQAFRGDEARRRQKFCYFGGIGTHLDIELYNSLAETEDVTFIGKFNSEEIRTALSPSIHVVPPVGNEQLATLLREMDVLALLYRKTAYVDGVIPAKIYECLATQKPIITTGMNEVKALETIVYLCDGIDDVRTVAARLPQTEDDDVQQQRRELAMEADWENRFRMLNERLRIHV